MKFRSSRSKHQVFVFNPFSVSRNYEQLTICIYELQKFRTNAWSTKQVVKLLCLDLHIWWRLLFDWSMKHSISLIFKREMYLTYITNFVIKQAQAIFRLLFNQVKWLLWKTINAVMNLFMLEGFLDNLSTCHLFFKKSFRERQCKDFWILNRIVKILQFPRGSVMLKCNKIPWLRGNERAWPEKNQEYIDTYNHALNQSASSTRSKEQTKGQKKERANQ